MVGNIRAICLAVIVIFLAACAGAKTAAAPSAYKAYTKIGSIGKVELWGGNGLTKETAIYIKNAKSSMDGIPAEYAYLNTKYGKRGEGYVFIAQVLTGGDGRKFDLLKIKTLPDSTAVDVYFDITDFFGKF